MTELRKEPESFEQALKDLEKIVQQLEQGELPLESALNAFQEGVALSQYCKKTLSDAEETVAKMMTKQGEVPLNGE